jgi:hypothetical protein
MSVRFDPSAPVIQQKVQETPPTSPRGVPGLSALSSISPSTAAPGGVSSVGMGCPQAAKAVPGSFELDAVKLYRAKELGPALRFFAQLSADNAYARVLQSREKAHPDAVDPDVTEAYVERAARQLPAERDLGEGKGPEDNPS